MTTTKNFRRMIARATAMLLLGVLIVTTAQAQNDSGNCGNGVGWKLDSEGTFTISGNGSMYDYGNTVVPWYSYRNDIHTVVIEDGVTTIGNYAFYGCSGLTSLTIGNSVSTIGNHAFEGCTSLTSVTIPNSVTYIGNDAFNNTAWYDNQPDGLVYAGKVAYKYKGTMPEGTAIEILEGTLGITDDAFYGCSGLTSVTIPNSVTSIGEYAFYGCI